MRPKRRRIKFNEELESKKLIYISIAVAAIAILTFVTTYSIYSNVLSKDNNSAELSKIAELSNIKNNEKTSEASNPLGKTVNELSEENETTKIAINTTNIEKQMLNDEAHTSNNIEISENLENKVQATTATLEKSINKEETTQDPTFIKPVDGEIIKDFANENLVYSDTLKEWITHTGIDIKADKTTIVKASSDGVVQSIKNDPRYGITVTIEHSNGFISVYSNLLTAEFVKEGEEVKQGQTIGTVGNTASFEILDESHLHFEILKDNKYLNPSEYIK